MEIGESIVVFHKNNSCICRNYEPNELQEEGSNVFSGIESSMWFNGKIKLWWKRESNRIDIDLKQEAVSSMW